MTSADLLALIKKQPIGFGCAIICIALGAALYVRSSKITDSQAAYETKAAEAAKILANVQNSAKLTEQTAEAQALTKELESRLMHVGQLAVNQQYFYKLEAENEVKLMDLRQGTPAKSGGLYTGIPYNVTVQGTYAQVMAFLQKLEGGRHFCRFLNVSFTKVGAAADQTPSASMNLTLTLEILGQP